MEIEQTALPGIGLRHEFTTNSGRRVGVVSHRNGRREFVIYDRSDPDAVAEYVTLNDEEADALAELLGAPRIVQRLNELHREVEGVMSVQVPIEADSPYVGRRLGETATRTRTGASIVAIVRAGKVIASPGPDFVFNPDDVIVVVGTDDGVAAVAEILARG